MNTFTGTWMGRQGETYDVPASDGWRVNVHTWTDTGEVVIARMKGSGRTKDFQQGEVVTLTSPTQAQIDAAVQRLAAL